MSTNDNGPLFGISAGGYEKVRVEPLPSRPLTLARIWDIIRQMETRLAVESAQALSRRTERK